MAESNLQRVRRLLREFRIHDLPGIRAAALSDKVRIGASLESKGFHSGGYTDGSRARDIAGIVSPPQEWWFTIDRNRLRRIVPKVRRKKAVD